MRNEMNLLDVLLAKKLSGGGSGIDVRPGLFTLNGTYTATINEAYSPVTVDVRINPFVTTASSFSTLTIPSIPEKGINVGWLQFSFMGQTAGIPIRQENAYGGYAISGGQTNGVDGAVIIATYTPDVQGVTVQAAGRISNGTYTDITAYMSAATDIQMTWYAPSRLP